MKNIFKISILAMLLSLIVITQADAQSMRVGRNTAVGTSAEDIIGQGATLTEPTAARIHTLVSDSAEDDADGILQVETATVHSGDTISTAGNATITVTSSLVTGSPLAISVAVALRDRDSAIGRKIRYALNNTAAITDYYTVSGSLTTVVLTAKTKAANNTGLNIAIATGTAAGIVTVASSANTTAGVLGTGARTVEVTYINSVGAEARETVSLNGTSGVAMTHSAKFINEMKVLTAGSGGVSAGNITATAATDNTVTSKILAGANRAQQAILMAPKASTYTNFYVYAYNATSAATTTVELQTKEPGGVWVTQLVIVLTESNPSFADNSGIYLPVVKLGSLFKVTAVASAGSSNVVTYFKG